MPERITEIDWNRPQFAIRKNKIAFLRGSVCKFKTSIKSTIELQIPIGVAKKYFN